MFNASSHDEPLTIYLNADATEDSSPCTYRLSSLSRSALITFTPVLFGIDTAV